MRFLAKTMKYAIQDCMDDSTKEVGVIVVSIIMTTLLCVAIAFGSLCLSGLVLWGLWSWIAVGYFGLPAIGFWAWVLVALAISLLKSLVFGE